ncbi:MAG: hypothetical protein WC959_01335 [Kiritimatiellales bacterium]
MPVAEGVDVAKVDPESVRDVAQSKKILARTDKIDTRIISMFTVATLKSSGVNALCSGRDCTARYRCNGYSLPAKNPNSGQLFLRA